MLHLEIVTPEKRVLDADVDSVTVPTASGEIGIFPSHAPLISALKPGFLTYAIKGVPSKLVVSGGFVEVAMDKVAVLADTAESADEIDMVQAREARDHAEKAFAAVAAAPLDETEVLRERLDAASARLSLAAGK